jgi:hypothetical protein
MSFLNLADFAIVGGRKCCENPRYRERFRLRYLASLSPKDRKQYQLIM